MRVDRNKLARQKLPPDTDARGNPLCRECSKVVKPPRRSFCSAACVHLWKMATNLNYVRSCVRKRDRGICTLCREDTEKLRRTWKKQVTNLPLSSWPDMLMMAQVRGYSGRIRAHRGRLRVMRLWDAHHITPVKHSTTTCELDGYMTLCVPCHKKIHKLDRNN